MAWRFLVVDPSPDVRSQIQRAFSIVYPDAVVDEAEDGRAGLRSLSGSRVHAVITGWRMPGMDGEALLQALRRNPVLARKPMLVYGASREERTAYRDDAGIEFLDNLPTSGSLAGSLQSFTQRHLALAEPRPALVPAASAFGAGRRIIFLSVNASARGPMAEALAQSMLGSGFIVAAAGFRAAGVHPMAIRALSELGIDMAGLPSRAVRDLDTGGVELVINLCYNEIAPILPGRIKRLDWPVPDPLRGGGSDEEQMQRFRQARESLSRRVNQLALELRRPVLV